ncbi:MAG: alginate export family protein [Bdellovibrionales bacterium]|nr:alginate export family protein [Bdellovibrionales bacterium]
MKTSWLAVALLTVLSLPSTARAEFEVKGQMRARTEVQNDTDFAGDRVFHLLRFRPTIAFLGPNERRFVFEPQFAQAFGALQGGATQTSGAAVDPGLGLHQAYAMLPAGDFSFQIGRQVFAYGDELVLGALEWSVVGRAFDAARVRYSTGEGFTDLFASMLAETGQSAASDGDFDIFGIYHSMNLGESLREFDLYVLYTRDARGGGPLPVDLWTAGTRAKADLGTVDYRAEVTYQSGRFLGSRETAYQADAELGVEPFEGGRVNAGAFVASAEYRQLFPTAHKWLGTADVFGRRNILGPRAGIQGLFGKLKTSLDLHYFLRADGDVAPFALNGATALGDGGGPRGLGTEVDLTLSYPVDDGLTLSGGVSTLFAGPYLRQRLNAENPLFGYAQIDLKF